jgi:hypothetical protein
MSINSLKEIRLKYPGAVMLMLFLLLILTIYMILFIFYSRNNIEELKYPPLKRRNALKPGEIDKILKNIRRIKNLRINETPSN